MTTARIKRFVYLNVDTSTLIWLSEKDAMILTLKGEHIINMTKKHGFLKRDIAPLTHNLYQESLPSVYEQTEYDWVVGKLNLTKEQIDE